MIRLSLPAQPRGGLPSALLFTLTCVSLAPGADAFACAPGRRCARTFP